MRFKATSYELFTAVSFLLNELELTVTLPFIQNTLCFTNKNAISQITTCFSVFTLFFQIKCEKYSYCLWWMLIDFQINLLCPYSPPYVAYLKRKGNLLLQMLQLESLLGQENMIILLQFYWLPIKFRISYKILLLAYKALNYLAPAYLTNVLSRYNPTHSLRLQNSWYYLG